MLFSRAVVVFWIGSKSWGDWYIWNFIPILRLFLRSEVKIGKAFLTVEKTVLEVGTNAARTLRGLSTCPYAWFGQATTLSFRSLRWGYHSQYGFTLKGVPLWEVMDFRHFCNAKVSMSTCAQGFDLKGGMLGSCWRPLFPGVFGPFLLVNLFLNCIHGRGSSLYFFQSSVFSRGFSTADLYETLLHFTEIYQWWHCEVNINLDQD